MRRAELFLVIVVLLGALAVRVVSLSADPPGWLSWSAGIYSDEGIYSADARLWTLYHQRMPGDFRVSVIAPLQNEAFKIAFRHIGVSLRAVRLVSVLFSMGVLAAFWLSMRVAYGRRSALVALILLSCSAPFVLYNRLGLMETPALFWLTAGAMCLVAGERRTSVPRQLPWLIASGVLAGAAVAWKATFVLGAAPLMAYALVRLGSKGAAAVAGFSVALGVYAALFWLPHRRTLARIDSYYLTRQYLPHSAPGLMHDVVRGVFTGQGDGVIPYLIHFAPLLVLLAVGAAVFPRLRSRQDTWLWLWFGIPVAACLALNYTPSRYFVIFWPPLAGLAACAITRLPNPRLWVPIALAAALLSNGAMLFAAYRDRTYTEQADGRTLQRYMPRDAWLAGQFAPELCLENSLRAIYVQPGLANSEANLLTTLPITHVLATVTATRRDDPWASHYAHLIYAPAGLKTLPVGRKFTVRVYASLDALP